MKVTLRSYDKVLDYGFIISTWPKSVYEWAEHDNKLDQEWFKDKFNDVNAQLERWTIRMAVDTVDPSFIFGYSLSTYDFIKKHRAIKFVYVKSAYRNQKIGSLLCGPEILYDYTNADWTPLGHKIVDDRSEKLRKEVAKLLIGVP